MTPTQDMIERVAKAIYGQERAFGGGQLITWDQLCEEDRNHWRKLARAAIEAMGEVHSQATPPDLTSTVPEAWRPISTAPRDGTHMLVSCTNGQVYAVRWGPLKDDAWVVIGGSDLSVGRVQRVPTHWKPLPSPPTGASGNPGGAGGSDGLRIDQAISKLSSQHMTAGGREG